MSLTIAQLPDGVAPDTTTLVVISDGDCAILDAFLATQVDADGNPKYADEWDLIVRNLAEGLLTQLRNNPQYASADPTLAAAHQAVTDAQAALATAVTAVAAQPNKPVPIKPTPIVIAPKGIA